MTNFPILRTHRLTVQLRELTIGRAISIASMPPQFEQSEMTAFLRAVIDDAAGKEDPLEWTVQERMMTVCHYLAATSESPNFEVGEGHFSDYLDASKDLKNLEPRAIGEICGDKWMIRPLTGRMAEAIERLQGELTDDEGKPFGARLHWIFGAMAAQLIRETETVPTAQTDGAVDEWLLDRMRVFLAFPQSDFELLLAAYWKGFRELDQLFVIDFRESGIVALPTKEGTDLPPARFPISSCLSPLAEGLG